MGNLLFLINNNSIKIIGIAGGTGSGKTYLANILIKKFGYNNIDKIEVDAYYKDLSHLSMEQRIQNNFDHPESFDFESLIKDLNYLKNGKNINIPVYDYTKHIRTKNIRKIDSKIKIVILEGIFALHRKEILKLLSYKVFLDIPENICLDRRIDRDIKKRDRTHDDIIEQYKKTVKPMYNKFIKPTKKNSDIIIKNINKADSGYIKLMGEINNLIN